MTMDAGNGRRDDGDRTFADSRLGGFLGFVIGFSLGWAMWALLVNPRLDRTPTPDNPGGEPVEWLYYGSLALCIVAALFIVAVIGEFIGSRRRKAHRA